MPADVPIPVAGQGARRPDAPAPAADTSPTGAAPALTRAHARRLREIYRSAGWPSQDGVEIELLAAGLVARQADGGGGERLRVTDAGVACLAQVLQRNRQAMSVHEALVAQVAQNLLRAGRVVWTGLTVRARLPDPGEAVAEPGLGDTPADPDSDPAAEPDGFMLTPGAGAAARARWKVCKPDVFSIRNTTVAGYLQPVVHEIKVSRADLLGDLRLRDKRDSYLDIGGQCWYVLGCDTRGRPIARADEVPPSCGVIHALPDARLEVVRHAPARAVPDLPFALWMALAKATPLVPGQLDAQDMEPVQALLREPTADGAGAL